MAASSKKAPAPASEPLMPPVVPDDRLRLNEALMLLGSRAKTELRSSARTRLTELVGAYPDAATAAAWKRALKQLRDEEPFLFST